MVSGRTEYRIKMRCITYENVSKIDRGKQMRNNIFNIIKSRRNPLLEITRIDELLNKDDGVYVADEIFAALTNGTPTSIIKYIDENLFKSWKQRGTCINCDDFERTLGINNLPSTEDELTNEFILVYCEYVANMIYLLKQGVAKQDKLTDTVYATEENLKKFLAWYNYEIKHYPKEQKVLVVPKNAYATSVAEGMEDEALAYSVVAYNHYLLKGDIEQKKSILLALGSNLEPHRKEIAAIDKKLEDSIFFMLNNLNLRHNNRKIGDKNYNEKIAKMRKAKLEKWYDELYQLMLTAYITLENKKRILEVDKLKAEITT